MKPSRSRKIRLLLVDDHPIVLEGIKSRLSAQDGLEVVGDAADGEDALRQAAALKPDVILMDISMPRMNGIHAMGLLRRRVPGARILVLTMHDNREYIAQMIRLGARGYVLKDTAPAELIRAIKLVHQGGVFFSPAASGVMLDELCNQQSRGRRAALSDPLTAREREVLSAIAEGHSNKRIASALGLSVRTVETHRERVMRKLNIHTIAGLTKYAITQGLVRL